MIVETLIAITLGTPIGGPSGGGLGPVSMLDPGPSSGGLGPVNMLDPGPSGGGLGPLTVPDPGLGTAHHA
jgi:hypothetical protein